MVAGETGVGSLGSSAAAAARTGKASWASNSGVARSMRSNRRKDTKPEIAIRSLLHNQGLRYRVDFAPLASHKRRRADIVFTRLKIAVFIDRCFWHGCPEHATYPKRNEDYWLPKLARNIERDRETDAILREAGWTVIRIWEHEDVERAVESIKRTIGETLNHYKKTREEHDAKRHAPIGDRTSPAS